MNSDEGRCNQMKALTWVSGSILYEAQVVGALHPRFSYMSKTKGTNMTQARMQTLRAMQDQFPALLHSSVSSKKS